MKRYGIGFKEVIRAVKQEMRRTAPWNWFHKRRLQRSPAYATTYRPGSRSRVEDQRLGASRDDEQGGDREHGDDDEGDEDVVHRVVQRRSNE